MIPDLLQIGSPEKATEPAWWWGTVWSQPVRFSLPQLVESGYLGADVAALLWTSVEHGRSVTIAAGLSGAGKTTLLTSLLPAIPASKTTYYVRGMYESFGFLRTSSARDATLLVSEISPHLPAYCWGDSLRRVLEAGASGFQILSTIHAASTEEIIHTLAAKPMSLRLDLIAQLGLIVFLEFELGGTSARRRVGSVVWLDYDASDRSINALPLVKNGEIVESSGVSERLASLDWVAR